MPEQSTDKISGRFTTSDVISEPSEDFKTIHEKLSAEKIQVYTPEIKDMLATDIADLKHILESRAKER